MIIRSAFSILLALWAACSVSGRFLDHQINVAVVDLVAANNSGVSGSLRLEQWAPGGSVLITGQIFGLPRGLHGFHVHASGALGNDCLDAGSHFNPFEANHGAPTSSNRHVGDLGNVVSVADSFPAEVIIYDKVISLEETSPAFIVGKAVVIHEGQDDVGLGGNNASLSTGNAGGRLACGLIRHQEQ